MRANRKATGAIEESLAIRRLTKVPRAVQRRGYWAPGEQRQATTDDLPDYSGFAPSGHSIKFAAAGSASVPLGALWDLNRNGIARDFSLPLEQFFQHLAVIAPPGKGKTYGVIAPLAVRLLRAGASVITLDVTGDLPEQIQAFAREQPSASPVPVKTRHWSVHPQRQKHSWNPLDGVRSGDTVAIEGIKAAVLGDEPPDPKHRDFHERDLRIFGSLLHVALEHLHMPNLSAVAELATDGRQLARLAQRSDPYMAAGLQDLIDDGDTLWGLKNKLHPFLDSGIRSVMDHSDFSLSDLTNQRHLMIVGAEMELRERSKASSALFVNRLMSVLQGRYGNTGGVPVVLVLDEAPQIAERIDLKTILATARAARVGVVIAAQNVAQFGDATSQSETLDSCDGLLLLAGGSDTAAQTFQQRLGRRRVQSMNYGQDLRRSERNTRVDVSSDEAEVASIRDLIDPPFGRHPAFLHLRSFGSLPIALELDRSATTPR